MSFSSASIEQVCRRERLGTPPVPEPRPRVAFDPRAHAARAWSMWPRMRSASVGEARRRPVRARWSRAL